MSVGGGVGGLWWHRRVARRVPVLRRMRFLRYQASKDVSPDWSISLMRCGHGNWTGLHVRRGMRCYSWIWRTCK
jgi:hypothetical protein